MTDSNFYKENIDKLKNINRLRYLTECKTKDNGIIEIDGKEYINLSSNDYLNIASSVKFREEFYNKFDFKNLPFGSTSSRLMTGNSYYYKVVEFKLSLIYQKEAALVFSSGYHLNSGIMHAITKKGDVIYSDKLNHASIINGMQLSDCDYFRYPHLDYKKLEQLLINNKDKYKNTFVVTESVFSMDGDLADLKKLVELKKLYNFTLIVDEAHGFGVFGNFGKGVCETNELERDIDIIIGTFGKAAGGMGAFLVCNKEVKEWLVNSTRSLIFTTALPPIQLAWLSFSIDKLISMKKEREKLLRLSKKLKKQLKKEKIKTFGDSHIIPIMAGSDKDAIKLSEKMRENGFFVFPVRPPTVPIRKCRLRISLTTALKKEDVLRIPEILKNE